MQFLIDKHNRLLSVIEWREVLFGETVSMKKKNSFVFGMEDVIIN